MHSTYWFLNFDEPYLKTPPYSSDAQAVSRFNYSFSPVFAANCCHASFPSSKPIISQTCGIRVNLLILRFVWPSLPDRRSLGSHDAAPQHSSQAGHRTSPTAQFLGTQGSFVLTELHRQLTVAVACCQLTRLYAERPLTTPAEPSMILMSSLTVPCLIM